MRKLLLGLAVLLGATAAVSGARAAPPHGGPVPLTVGPTAVQRVYYDASPAQYDEDWRYREWRRREEFERWRRHREWRHERHEEYRRDRRGW